MKSYISFLKYLPKIELHKHIEGSIPFFCLEELLQKYPDLNNKYLSMILQRKSSYKNLYHFLEHFIMLKDLINDYDDVAFIIHGITNELIYNNVKYAELFYTIDKKTLNKFNTQVLLDIITKTFNKYKDSIEIKLIVDFDRDNGPDHANNVLEMINEMRNSSIIGIGLGGTEINYSNIAYEKTFKKAKSYCFFTTAHAGEDSNSESIWIALKKLHVNRIGHGIKAINDKFLLDYLKKNFIPIEMSTISNIKTRTIKRYSEHPIIQMFKGGLNVFVNTDDPTLLNSRLVAEFQLLIKKLGFTLSDIVKLNENAICSAWCDNQKKQELYFYLNQYIKNNNVYPVDI